MSRKPHEPLWSLHPATTIASLLDDRREHHVQTTRRAGEYVERRKPGELCPAIGLTVRQRAAAHAAPRLIDRVHVLLIALANRYRPRPAIGE